MPKINAPTRRCGIEGIVPLWLLAVGLGLQGCHLCSSDLEAIGMVSLFQFALYRQAGFGRCEESQ